MKTRVKSKKMIIIFSCIGVFLILNVFLMFGIKNRFVTYRDLSNGFSIMHPPEWEVRNDVSGVAAVILSPKENDIDTYYENVTIVVQDIVALYGQPMSFKDYSEKAIKEMDAVFEDHFEVLEAGEFTLRGRPAYRYVFKGKGHEVIIKNMAVWTMEDGKAYQLFFTALESSYDQYVLKAKRMINSFRIE